LTAKGAVSQTANIQEWQVSTGAIVAQATPFVFQVGPSNSYPARMLLGASDTSALLSVSTQSTTQPGAIIRGRASQSANLQEWQNSGGTILAKVDASGNVTAVKFVTSGGTSSQFVKGDGSLDSSTYATPDTAIATNLMLGGM
jgi:hypothetical protein